jgi:dynein heavy chain
MKKKKSRKIENTEGSAEKSQAEESENGSVKPTTGLNDLISKLDQAEQDEGELAQKMYQVHLPKAWSFKEQQDNFHWLPKKEVRKKGINELSVSCMMGQKIYGYEYLGNQARLVITPLTDKCFQTIFLAMHYSYGTMLVGPVGTGKTETTLELAKSLGKMCFSFQCSPTLNFDSIFKFFKGFVTGGTWACFDEFNRLNLSVLQALSQTMMSITQAHREQKETITMSEDAQFLPFNNQCTIFITMNYDLAGRNDLPYNLQNQFRPVQMTVPNSEIITEVILQCSGFLNSQSLARKLVKLLDFAQNQLP